MKNTKKQEFITRFNELAEKYNNTKSMALKGYYAGEMAWIDEVFKLVRESKKEQ